MIQVTIRKEQKGDEATLSKLIYTAFLNHPHHAPGSLPTEHTIVENLRTNNALSLSLVAESSNEIIGHLAFSEVLINHRNCQWYGLGPVCVSPKYQRQGVGKALIHDGISRLKAACAKGLVVLGDPAYYRQFGFRNSSSLILDGVPEEYFMSLPLADEMPTGKAIYHSAFGG